MLKYELTEEEDGLRATFIRNTGLIDVVAVLFLFRFASWTWMFLRRVLYSTTDTSSDKGNVVLFALCAIITIAIIRIILSLILRIQAVFSPAGIRLCTTFFGIPVRETWFAEDEIHRFGLNQGSHGSSSAFGFAASGSFKFLSYGVKPDEVRGFINLLGAKGIEYSGESEPRHRVSAGNSFLR